MDLCQLKRDLILKTLFVFFGSCLRFFLWLDAKFACLPNIAVYEFIVPTCLSRVQCHSISQFTQLIKTIWFPPPFIFLSLNSCQCGVSIVNCNWCLTEASFKTLELILWEFLKFAKLVCLWPLPHRLTITEHSLLRKMLTQDNAQIGIG